MDPTQMSSDSAAVDVSYHAAVLTLPTMADTLTDIMACVNRDDGRMDMDALLHVERAYHAKIVSALVGAWKRMRVHALTIGFALIETNRATDGEMTFDCVELYRAPNGGPWCSFTGPNRVSVGEWSDAEVRDALVDVMSARHVFIVQGTRSHVVYPDTTWLEPYDMWIQHAARAIGLGSEDAWCAETIERTREAATALRTLSLNRRQRTVLPNHDDDTADDTRGNLTRMILDGRLHCPGARPSHLGRNWASVVCIEHTLEIIERTLERMQKTDAVFYGLIAPYEAARLVRMGASDHRLDGTLFLGETDHAEATNAE